MSNGIIAFLLGISIATWVYSKFMRSTGGNSQSAITGAVTIAVVVFLIAFTLLNLIPE
jgi:hypothetical protein